MYHFLRAVRIAALSIIALFSCSSFINAQPITPKALDFIVLGDWGRAGRNYQKQVAKQMAIESTHSNAAFIISTGDNFYEEGVRTVTDPQWDSSFNWIYSASS